MKCLLLVANGSHSKHKAGFLVFHSERNNLISKFCPLTSYSWTIISHISDFGLLYVAPRTKRKFKKEPGYIYVIGGYDNIKKKFSRKILRYDMIRGEWFHCAKMTVRRSSFTPFLYDGKIYMAGGKNSKMNLTDTVEYYEPMMDKVYEAKHLPLPCSNYACTFSKKNVFIIGGNIQQKNGLINYSSHFWSLTKCEENVDEEGKTSEILYQWINIKEAKVPIEDGIIGHKAVICEENNRIYVIGGINRNNESKNEVAGLYYADIEPIIKYDTREATNDIIWYKRSFNEMQRSNCGVSLINNKIFVIGGLANKFNSTFSIAEVNEDDEIDTTSSVPRTQNFKSPEIIHYKKPSHVLLMPVNETIGYYDWHRKIFCEMFKLRHFEDIDLENIHTTVIDIEDHFAEFKNDNFDWMLQWPLW